MGDKKELGKPFLKGSGREGPRWKTPYNILYRDGRGLEALKKKIRKPIRPFPWPSPTIDQPGRWGWPGKSTRTVVSEVLPPGGALPFYLVWCSRLEGLRGKEGLWLRELPTSDPEPKAWKLALNRSANLSERLSRAIK